MIKYEFHNEGIISGPWSIPEEQYHFNRIGQYDFTKKDEGKIEPLSDNYTESFPIFKTQNSVTGKTYKQECYSIDIGWRRKLMKWHKVEDYPVGSDEFVLVSRIFFGERKKAGCFVASLNRGCWVNNSNFATKVRNTDRWGHIDLPEE